MSPIFGRAAKGAVATALGALLAAGALVVPAAQANVDGTGVVINEVYSRGGSANQPFTHKFVELSNPTAAPIAVDGWSLQYRNATNDSAPTVVALNGEIPAGGTYLIQGAANNNGAVGVALPTPDATGGLNLQGQNGVVYLANTIDAVIPVSGSVVDNPQIVDLVGYGSGLAFEGAAATYSGANSDPRSIQRTAGLDTDNNLADFAETTTPTPQNSSGTTPEPEPEPEPGTVIPIAEIQGASDASPLVGELVTTRGVVTAAYPTGGYDGFYVQTPGTGTSAAAEQLASDGIFVNSLAAAGNVTIGDHVEVTGTVEESFGLTRIVVSSPTLVTTVEGDAVLPIAKPLTLPVDGAIREAHEGMLIAPQGGFTVSNTYNTNTFAEIGLAVGDSPLITPTEIARPGSPEYLAAAESNANRSLVVDDGSSVNYTGGGANTPVPYLTDIDVTVGDTAVFAQPVILDYRFDLWRAQPTAQLVAGAPTPVAVTGGIGGDTVVEPVGGDVTLGSFNVLNYFATTGDSLPGCVYYNDREGNPITVREGCDARGAANADDLERQEAKIVAALNEFDASVVGLEEIENSAALGKPRDFAVETLVAALNEEAGSEKWAFVPSPAAVPADEDVIRNAFIYQPAEVEPVGSSQILLDSPAFGNAREPLAQAFAPVDGTDDEKFVAIVNHFKSKGSGSGPGNVDAGDGQGASNADRVAQAQALVAFAEEVEATAETELTFLLGDFNSYTQEDPMQVFAEAGFVNQNSKAPGEYSYSFDGASGSLDHILASEEADIKVSGADIWEINAGESIAFEYSRFNTNVTDFYTEDVYRSSDHNPLLVGIDFDAVAPPVDINLLNINDFHGRIDPNTTKFATTIERLRAEQGEQNTLFLSNGDNIGASLFASSVQDDQPTIDVLNALELDVTSVGNHEFDRGFADLTDRVVGPDDARNAQFNHLGANVYLKGTTTPALPEYELFEVDGVAVAVIGAVTDDTYTLVSPAGIAGLDFGDPVEAINRVAAELTDGVGVDAEVIVAEYHEGAPGGNVEGATLESAVADSEVFASIVNDTSAEVDVIFTGHSHRLYDWDGPIPGEAGETRPIIQTGSYGANIGQVVLTVDPETGDVISYTGANVPRDAKEELTYPRVAEVKAITDAALEQAKILGAPQVGSVTADITTAFTGGSYVDGKWVGSTRDNRTAESTLGNLVANSLRDSLSDPALGGAEIGITNPGGLRDELYFGTDAGVVTYGEAAAVLPFANNLFTASLTGDQLKAVLEQQWRVTAGSTTKLNLGVSDNVKFTFNADLPQGERILDIWIDGEPVDPTASYRVSAPSFLIEGGDAFTAFRGGTNVRDSGRIDLDAWSAYLTANPGLSPNFARNSVEVLAAPTAPVEIGDTVEIDLRSLNLTSLGSPENTTVTATWSGSSAAEASFSVTDGAASLSLVVPEDALAASLVTIVAEESGTTTQVAVEVEGGLLEPVDPTDPPTDPTKPTSPSSPPLDEQLTDALKDQITLSDYVLSPGETFTITLGEEYAGQWVAVWLTSTPLQFGGGWLQVAADGTVTTTVPDNAEAGAHRLSVLAADGSVIGWADVTITGGGLAVTGSEIPAGGLALAMLLMLGGIAVTVRRRRTA